MMNSNLKQIALNLVLLLLAFSVQTCVFPLLPFLSAYPNLMLILIFSFGFIRGSASGMCYGLVAGLLMDLSSGGPMGFYTLFYIWMGYLTALPPDIITRIISRCPWPSAWSMNWHTTCTCMYSAFCSGDAWALGITL